MNEEHDFKSNSQKKLFFGVLLLCFLLRFSLYLYILNYDSERFMLYDSYGYAAIAENYIDQGIYSQSYSAPYFPDLFRPPGYSFLIGLVVAVGGDLGLLMFIQVLLSLLSCYLAMKSCQLLFKNKTWLIAGILIATDIPSIVMTNLVMSETLFTFFFCLSIYSFARFHKFNLKKYLLYAGIFLGLAVLVRPIGIYFFIPVLLVMAFTYRQKFLAPALYVCVPFLLLTGSWAVRNYIVHDHFFYSKIGHFNLLYFQAADIYAEQENLPINVARNELYYKVSREMDVRPYDSAIEFYDRFQTLSKEIILAHPFSFFKNAVIAEINLFFRPMRGYLDYQLGYTEITMPYDQYSSVTGTENFLSLKSSLFTRITVYFQYLISPLVFFFAIFGLILLYRSEKFLFFLFLFLLLYFMAVCSGPEMTDARFRVPLFPLLSILAAFSINHWTTKRWATKKRAGSQK